MAKRERRDTKHDALRQHGILHARASDVTDPLFAKSDFFDPRDALQVKYEMLRRVRVDGLPILRAAQAFGFSRPAFYQAQAAFVRAGLAGLLPAKRGPHRAHKLSVPVVAFLRKQLGLDGSLTATALAGQILDRFGVSVHPRSIERALSRPKKKPP